MYGSGFFIGMTVVYIPVRRSLTLYHLGQEFTDTVHLGDLTIENQSFGGALLAEGFDDVDGILGIGPVALTCGTSLSTARIDSCSV